MWIHRIASGATHISKYPYYYVVNLDKLDACSFLKIVEQVQDNPNYKFVKGDITSADLVSYILKTERIDTILSLGHTTTVMECGTLSQSTSLFHD